MKSQKDDKGGLWMIKMKKEVHILFVYGSLMTGEYNHDYYLADACCLGQASIFGFALYNLGSFPGIKHTEEPFRVCGELYEVNQSDFDRICMLFWRIPGRVLLRKCLCT